MKKSKDIASQFIEIAPKMVRTTKAEIRHVAQGKITHPQYRILANINRGTNTVSQIALNQGVSQPAMSKNVDALVRKGLIDRVPQSTDRRQITLQLSKKGNTLFQKLKTLAAARLAEKFKVFSPSELAELHDSLTTLDSLLKKLMEKQQDQA